MAFRPTAEGKTYAQYSTKQCIAGRLRCGKKKSSDAHAAHATSRVSRASSSRPRRDSPFGPTCICNAIQTQQASFAAIRDAPSLRHTAALDRKSILGACAVLPLRFHRMKGRARGTSAVDWRQGAVETTLAIRLSRGVMGSTGSGLQSCLLHRRGNDGDAASISDRVSTISGLSFPSERSNTPL